tara:strand:+ start:486 stop:1082 length:597 start_codon:yes stop_codon:yes gene_type:complete
MANRLRKNYFFLKSVSSIKNLPDNSLFEFCFWGRSNVGKSSLLNSITNFKLANVSKTPGRTYTLNFFEKDKSFRLVDFPGYGYAKRSKIDIYNWNKLILNYLEIRKNIGSIFLLIDSRHGFKQIDKEALKILNTFNIKNNVVLTKIDKVKNTDLALCLDKITCLRKKFTSSSEKVFLTSSKKNLGIKEINQEIVKILS